MKGISRVTICIIIAWLSPCAVLKTAAGQSPPSSQERTGRSYTSGEPARRPATSAPQSPSPVTFTEITEQARVTFKHAASATSQKYLLETMGGGVAMLDYDNDGRMDLFFTNGAALSDPVPKGAMPDKRDPKYWNRLYRQKADGAFEDVTERAGVKGEGYSFGVAVGDYNNDGWGDMLVAGYGINILYRNNGDGTFKDATKQAGIGSNGWGTSAAWLDYNRDGRLDLFVARYMEWDFERGAIYCGDTRPGMRAYCHPDNFKGAANLLYRQKPDGTFEDVSAASRISEAVGKGLGVAIADFDSDGWSDIIVANDSVPQSLFRNLGDGTFEDVALPAGVAYDENAKTFAGMGVDAADYDGDGHIDIFITALANETYPLFRNNGDGAFTYATSSSGVAQITLPHSGWGTRFADIDNDGLRDIFVAQGHVLDTIEKISTYLKYKEPPLVMRNLGKNFVEVSATAGTAFSGPIAARGAATGDLDNDGDIDIVIAALDAAPVILRNNGAKNHWIGLSLAGAKSNRNGFGARVIVTDATGRTQIFDATSAGSYLSSSDPRIIVGLGAKTSVRSIEIRWPGNRAQIIENPQIDKYHLITEK